LRLRVYPPARVKAPSGLVIISSFDRPGHTPYSTTAIPFLEQSDWDRARIALEE